MYILETERLKLRRLSLDDLDEIYRLGLRMKIILRILIVCLCFLAAIATALAQTPTLAQRAFPDSTIRL